MHFVPTVIVVPASPRAHLRLHFPVVGERPAPHLRGFLRHRMYWRPGRISEQLKEKRPTELLERLVASTRFSSWSWSFSLCLYGTVLSRIDVRERFAFHGRQCDARHVDVVVRGLIRVGHVLSLSGRGRGLDDSSRFVGQPYRHSPSQPVPMLLRIVLDDFAAVEFGGMPCVSEI